MDGARAKEGKKQKFEIKTRVKEENKIDFVQSKPIKSMKFSAINCTKMEMFLLRGETCGLEKLKRLE